jgi:branched-chain amino acid transport system permease protein
MQCGTAFQCVSVVLQLLGIGLSNGAVIALNAIGVTLIYGAVRTINFAYGDLFALTTVVVTTMVADLGLRIGLPAGSMIGGLALILGVAVAVGTVLNVGIERIAFRPFRSGTGLAPLIATIGLSFILYQGALLWRRFQISGPVHHSDVDNLVDVPRTRIPDLVPNIDLLHVVGIKLPVSYSLKDLLVLLLAAVITVMVGWFLTRTRAGRALRACAQDSELAELCGVSRDASIRLSFAIGGALAGAAAFIFTLYYDRPFGQHGAQSGLVAFAAAVLGGIGNPTGAFLSGLLFGIIAALSDYFLSPQWTPVLILGILIVLLVLRPTGLAGEDRSEGLSEGSALVGGAGIPRLRVDLRSRLLTGAMLALGLAYPLLDRLFNLHQQSVITNIVLFAILALGLNILLGFIGILDLGYAAMFAIGGYATAIFTDHYGRLAPYMPGPLDFTIVLLLSGVVAALFGLLNGTLTLRLRGDYLAIVTLAFGQLVPQVVLNLDQLTGGASGMSALDPPILLTHRLDSPVERYYLAFGIVVVIALISLRLARSRIGRAWAALSADEDAALSCGVPLRAKLLAFVLGAIVAGIAGTLFATIFSYVNTDQSDFTISAMVLAMVIIGGAGSVRGAIIGALLIAGYNQFAVASVGIWLEQLGKTSGGWLGALITALDPRSLSYLFFGLALYLTVLFRARQPQPANLPASGAGGFGPFDWMATAARSLRRPRP